MNEEGFLTERQFRIVRKQAETVVDDGPHSGRVSRRKVTIWRDDYHPEPAEVKRVAQLQQEFDLENVTGIRRQLGMVDRILVERDDTAEVQHQRIHKIGWKTIHTVSISEDAEGIHTPPEER